MFSDVLAVFHFDCLADAEFMPYRSYQGWFQDGHHIATCLIPPYTASREEA